MRPSFLRRLFMHLSLLLCRCDVAWTCKWLYNISRFGACASRVLHGFKTNLVTVNSSLRHHNTTSTKGTEKKKPKTKKKTRTNEQQTDEQTDAKRKKEKKERKEEGNVLEEKKKKKKKTRNKNKPATKKEKRKKKNRKCKWIAHSCNFYLSLLFKLGKIVKDLF